MMGLSYENGEVWKSTDTNQNLNLLASSNVVPHYQVQQNPASSFGDKIIGHDVPIMLSFYSLSTKYT
jgi:hypothetical protein